MTDTLQEVVDLRRKVLAGEKVAPEEYAKVIESIREGRKKAGEVKKKKTKEPGRKVSVRDLFGGKNIVEATETD